MRILVNPGDLRNLAVQWRQAVVSLEEIHSHIQRSWSGLDWQVKEQADLETHVLKARRLAQSLADEAERLVRYLNDRADAFEQADQMGLAGISASVGGAMIAWLGGIPTMPAGLPTSNGRFASWSRISQMMGVPINSGVRLPVSGGDALIGLATLSSLPILGSSIPSLVESVWNWLHGYGWHTNSELASSSNSHKATDVSSTKLDKPTSDPTESRTTFGDLLQQSPKTEESTPPASPPTPPEQPVTSAVSVPNISQQGLQYNGENTQYGCTAASTSMVLEYWHARDPNVGTMSAQAIVDTNAKQGTFTSTGLSATDVHDEVSNLGYQTVEDRVNSDFSTLKQDVQQGPVIAVVKLGIQKSGYNHAVVVTNISDDGHVTINDPWDGQTHTYTSEKFQASWGADYGDMKNIYTVIRP